MTRLTRSRRLASGFVLMAIMGCDAPTSRPPSGRPSEAGLAIDRPLAPADQAAPSATPLEESETAMDRPIIRPYPEWTLSETAADALGRMGLGAVPELRKALHASEAEVRYLAARVLARIGPDAVAAVPDLIELLDDPNEHVRRIATRALGQIGPRASQAVPELIRLLDPTQEGLPDSEM